jgi:two-component system OmpR family response regulator
MAARILVVEDETNVRYVVAGALRLSEYEVVEATSGTDAFRHVRDQVPPDLVVLDVMLPDVDGFELCRRIRAEGHEVPVLFLTARDATEDRVRGLAIGGDDYLTKPFSIDELVARVRAILRRSGKATAGRVLVVDDLELDEDAHVVRRAGVRVPLSPTEYKLLRFLMRNRGRAMSRTQILDHVWNYDFEGESRIVETFVSSLRRKVERSGAPLIHTVRGHGYRLEAD